MIAEKPAPRRIPDLIAFGIAPMILLARPVIPMKRKISPTTSCKAIMVWTRSGPCSVSVKKAVTSGIAGVIHPGTTGSPNREWRL